MNEPTITGGNWKAEMEKGSLGVFRIFSDNGAIPLHICIEAPFEDTGYRQTTANANALSAVPEMLSVLKELEGPIGKAVEVKNTSLYRVEIPARVLSAVYEAIAKAEGTKA